MTDIDLDTSAHVSTSAGAGPSLDFWPEPGWYPDPSGAPMQRWWDGQQWTAFAWAATPAGPDISVTGRKTNGLAIASLVCSIAGLFTFGISAVAGIIFGFVARSQIRQSAGMQAGDGMAIAGIIVGLAMAALFLLGLIGIAAGAGG
jgi:hypothetical protein